MRAHPEGASPGEPRLSTTTKMVLGVLLAAGDEGSYGLQICDRADLASGTVHPILARLERAGWATSAWEDVDPASVGRPARRYYRLTSLGAQRAARVAVGTRGVRPSWTPGLARG